MRHGHRGAAHGTHGSQPRRTHQPTRSRRRPSHAGHSRPHPRQEVLEGRLRPRPPGRQGGPGPRPRSRPLDADRPQHAELGDRGGGRPGRARRPFSAWSGRSPRRSSGRTTSSSPSPRRNCSQRKTGLLASMFPADWQNPDFKADALGQGRHLLPAAGALARPGDARGGLRPQPAGAGVGGRLPGHHQPGLPHGEHLAGGRGTGAGRADRELAGRRGGRCKEILGIPEDLPGGVLGASGLSGGASRPTTCACGATWRTSRSATGTESESRLVSGERPPLGVGR